MSGHGWAVAMGTQSDRDYTHVRSSHVISGHGLAVAMDTQGGRDYTYGEDAQGTGLIVIIVATVRRQDPRARNATDAAAAVTVAVAGDGLPMAERATVGGVPPVVAASVIPAGSP